MSKPSNTAAVRESVFDREQYRCRIPWCDEPATEMAHLRARSLGGPDSTKNCIAACTDHHQGTRSLHSGHLKYEFLSERGADGPMTWKFQEEIGRFRGNVEEWL